MTDPLDSRNRQEFSDRLTKTTVGIVVIIVAIAVVIGLSVISGPR